MSNAAPHGPSRPAIVAHDLESLRRGLVALVPDLRTRALRLAGDRPTADDLVQDTVERALRFAAQYDPGTNLRAWTQQNPLQRLHHALPPVAPRAERAQEPLRRPVRVDAARDVRAPRTPTSRSRARRASALDRSADAGSAR